MKSKHDVESLRLQINQISNTNKYLQYKYDYDSQTNSVFAHNCKNKTTYTTIALISTTNKLKERKETPTVSHQRRVWRASVKHRSQSWQLHDTCLLNEQF